jgi:hypothetical protein
MQKLLVKR